jgi:hypothetical protein
VAHIPGFSRPGATAGVGPQILTTGMRWDCGNLNQGEAMSTPLTTFQAAKILGLSPSQTTRLAKQGRIPGASKPGRDWVFEPPLQVLPPERPPGWPRRRVPKFPP